MELLIVAFVAFVASLALFGFAANRWGADSRTLDVDPRNPAAFDRR